MSRSNLPIAHALTRNRRAVLTGLMLVAMVWLAGHAAAQTPSTAGSPGQQGDRESTVVFGQTASVSKTGSIGGLQAKFVDIRGVRTRYFEAGQGEAIVLLHGGGPASGHSSANTWVRNVPGLGKRYHVLAPDRLATGMTGNPLDDKDYNTRGEVEHVYQFIQTMKLGKVHLVGQSIGGLLAFSVAVAHPDVVKTLVIVNSASLVPVDTAETNRPGVLESCPDAKQYDCEEWRCRENALSASPERTFDEEFFASGCYMANLPKSREAMAKVAAGAGQPVRSQEDKERKTALARVKNEGILQMPILLYWGKDDPSAILKGGAGAVDMKGGLALFDVFAAKNRNVRMIVSNDAGHFHYREHPEEFNQNLINFFDFWGREAAKPTTTSAR